jgi:hypothetical protein
LPMTTVTMHIEPIEDHVSWQDQDLDRSSGDGAENQSY